MFPSIRIPAGKLGTVRVDRTVDVYQNPPKNNEIVFNVKTYIPTLITQHQSTVHPVPLVIEHPIDQTSFQPKFTWNQSSNRIIDNDDDVPDIAIIYSVVRRASTRRTSSPGISVLPLTTNLNIPQVQIAKSYTLEPPLTPTIVHSSKQAQIKTLPPSELLSTARVQLSNSFTSHDRSSIPLIAVKPRPYSFRSNGRTALERQISNITERVSQLQETFFSRISPRPQQRNRSQSTFQPPNINRTQTSSIDIHLNRPRPKSENYDEHHRILSEGNHR